MWHKSVLFTGTAKSWSPFATPHISITTGPFSIKFTYFMPLTLHAKFEVNRLSSLQHIRFWKLPNFFTFSFSSLHQFKTVTLSQLSAKMNFFQIWCTNNAHSGLSSPKIWRFKLNLRDLWMIILLKVVQKL